MASSAPILSRRFLTLPRTIPRHISYPATIRHSSTTSSSSTFTRTPTGSTIQIPSTSEPSLSLQSPPSSAPNPPSPTDLKPLPYHVHRTPGAQLPIYHLRKAGGNKHLTRIRKISGDVLELKKELKEALALGDKEISVNNVNGHIVIKGWRKIEVQRFLEGKYF